MVKKETKSAGRRLRSLSASDIATQIQKHLKWDLDNPRQAYVDDRGLRFIRRAQDKALLKKFVFDGPEQKALETQAFCDFIDRNELMGLFNGGFTTRGRPQDSRYSYMENVLIRARSLIWFCLRSLDEEEWFRECRHSGGASIGVPFKDTSITRKSQLPLSSTPKAAKVFDRYLNYNSYLRTALLKTLPPSDRKFYRYVSGSRATTVNKSTTQRRMIAIEPTVNMYLQQGLMHVLYERMRDVGLDVTSLPYEHSLRAFTSSIVGTESTIDWSNASDCVSISLLEYLLPPTWFWAVEQVRSPTMELDGSIIELNMISTMGNATTFPLETLVFWALGHAVRLTEERRNALFPEWEDLKRISVFGDDCIIPTGCTEAYIDVLSALGFQVNSEKSFSGNVRFRESCGGDYYRGFDVRPLFLQGPTSRSRIALEAWLYTVTNRVIQKYMSYFGTMTYVYDRRLLCYLAECFRVLDFVPKVVPPDMPLDAGLLDHGDLARLFLCCGFPFPARIDVSKQGTYRYSYLRYIYAVEKQRDDDVAYQTWLKLPEFDPRSISFPLRRKYRQRVAGRYVVAKGRCSSWTPSLGTTGFGSKPYHAWSYGSLCRQAQ